MSIKKAVIDDLPQLTILFDNYRIFYQQRSDIMKARTFLMERIENADSQIFVNENAENILTGFVQLYPIFSSTRMQRLWLLNDLYVDKPYRGQGISVRLIDQAKHLARETKASGLILETAKSNLIGNSLYPKVDFKLDKEHNFYFWDC